MSIFSKDIPQQTSEQNQPVKSLRQLHAAGETALYSVSTFYKNNRRRVVAGLAIGAAAGGNLLTALALETGTANAKGTQQAGAACEKYDTAAITLGAADKTVLPLATEMVSLWDNAKPSEKYVTKTSEMYGTSYSHVNEVNISIPAKFAKSPGMGTYSFTADFNGAIRPQNMVAIETAEYPKHLALHENSDINPNYDYILLRTSRNGISNTVGMHWLMSLTYGDRKNYFFVQSQLADGDEVPTSYVMTAPILTADIKQSTGVVMQASDQKPISYLPDLAATQKLVKLCY